MNIYSTITDIEQAILQVGDAVRILGERTEGDMVTMTGRVRSADDVITNRVVYSKNGLPIEIFPTPATDATKEFVEGEIHDFHTDTVKDVWQPSQQITSWVHKIFQDGEYRIPKTIPFVTKATWESDKDNWVILDSEQSTLRKVFGGEPVTLSNGLVVTPTNNQYPKLAAFGAIYELADNSVSYTVKSFTQAVGEDCIITLSDDSMLVAKKVDAVSKNYVIKSASVCNSFNLDGNEGQIYSLLHTDEDGEDLNVYSFSKTSKGLKGEITSPSGFYIPRNFKWNNAKARGIRQGSLNDLANNTLMLDMLNQSNEEGGVLELPVGQYHLGEIEHNWNFNSLRKEKGLVGKGVGLTDLIFDTSADKTVFDQSELSLWFRYENLTLTASDDKKGQFFGATFGSPRSKIEGLRLLNWRRAAEWTNWVSTINRVVAENCFEGFVVNGGTSLDLNALYSLNCDFGYILGCDRHLDGTYHYTGDSVYSTYRNLACDGSKVAAYTFGSNRGVQLSGGAEAVGGALFYFPIVQGIPAANQYENNPLIVSGFSAAGLNSSYPILSIERDHIRTKIENSTFSTNSKMFSDNFDFTNKRLGLELSNVGGTDLNLSDACW